VLLEQEAEMNRKDKLGWTVLHKAVGNRLKAMVRELLEKGADINAKDKNGWTAPHMAVKIGTRRRCNSCWRKGQSVRF
jgi:ankyrin repeat protein